MDFAVTLEPGVSAYVVPRQIATLNAQFVIDATAGVGAGVSDVDAVMDGVCVGETVFDGVSVGEAVREGVCVAVGVTDAVDVTELVWVGVADADEPGDGVLDCDDVIEGVTEGDGVGVGEHEGATTSPVAVQTLHGHGIAAAEASGQYEPIGQRVGDVLSAGQKLPAGQGDSHAEKRMPDLVIVVSEKSSTTTGEP